MAGEGPARLPRLHPPALHRVGTLEPEVGENRRRDVGHVHEPVALRRGRPQEPGREPGGAYRGDAQRVAGARRCRTDDQHRVVLGRPLEQPAHEMVGRLERARPDLHRLLLRREAGREVGSHQVGTFDQHGRARLPRVVEGPHHAVGVEAHPERRGVVVLQEPGVDPAARHLPVAGHERGHRGTPPGREPGFGRARIGAVAVGDDRARDPSACELVAEQPHLGAVELRVVGLDGVGDRHVHEPVAVRDPGAGGEHHARRVAPEVLVDPEALPAGGTVGGGTGARTHGHVPARQRRRPVDAVGDHRADGRLLEQRIEIRRAGFGEVGPLERRQRDDEDPAGAWRRGAGVDRGGQHGEADDDRDESRGREPPDHALTGSGRGWVFGP